MSWTDPPNGPYGMLDRDPPAGRYEDYHGSQILQLPNQANRRDLPAHLRRIPSWERLGLI